MKYIELEYSVNGLQESDKKAIQEFLQPYEEKYFGNFIKTFPQYEIPKIHLHISDDIWVSINEFYSDHDISYDKSRPKGLEHLIKVASTKEKTKYFWASNYFGELAVPIAFQVIIENLIGKQLNKQYKIERIITFDKGLQYLSKTLFTLWVVHLVTKETASAIVESTKLDYESMEDLMFAFKKNIKHFHHEYQSNQDNYQFLINSVLELEIFIRRILSYKTETNLSKLDEFEDDIISLIQLVNSTKGYLGKFDENILNSVNLMIIKILQKCDIQIYEDSESKNIGFRITEGPKKLFKDLIDTHPRIVCFLDILGFKALIEEYENVNNSLVLKELKTVFDAAIEASFTLLTSTMDKDEKEELEYRMFSDCIIISLPYIEFGIDIKKGFHNIALILNVMQQTFMKSGFYLRGHVTIGSYYSDDNMLFSGGLVEAYMNESTTIYPIISINNKIIKKLEKKTEYDESLLSFEKLLIKHNYGESENNIFINPFYTIDIYKNLDIEFNRILSSGIGSNLTDLGLDFSFKSLLNKELNKEGIPLIEKEVEKDQKEIIKVLVDKYNKQIEIYQNMNNDHKTRNLASSIIAKYKFLHNLFSWLEENNINDNFEFVKFE